MLEIAEKEHQMQPKIRRTYWTLSATGPRVCTYMQLVMHDLHIPDETTQKINARWDVWIHKRIVKPDTGRDISGYVHTYTLLIIREMDR